MSSCTSRAVGILQFVPHKVALVIGALRRACDTIQLFAPPHNCDLSGTIEYLAEQEAFMDGARMKRRV